MFSFNLFYIISVDNVYKDSALAHCDTHVWIMSWELSGQTGLLRVFDLTLHNFMSLPEMLQHTVEVNNNPVCVRVRE